MRFVTAPSVAGAIETVRPPEALGKAGVAIRQCGQSPAASGIAAADLAASVSMAVSAMTVVVRRQSEGWMLLP